MSKTVSITEENSRIEAISPPILAGGSVEDSQRSDQDDFAQAHKKLAPEEQIEHTFREIQEVIAFLDYSFERAYTVKEREYIMAYRVSYFQIL